MFHLFTWTAKYQSSLYQNSDKIYNFSSMLCLSFSNFHLKRYSNDYYTNIHLSLFYQYLQTLFLVLYVPSIYMVHKILVRILYHTGPQSSSVSLRGPYPCRIISGMKTKNRGPHSKIMDVLKIKSGTTYLMQKRRMLMFIYDILNTIILFNMLRCTYLLVEPAGFHRNGIPGEPREKRSLNIQNIN